MKNQSKDKENTKTNIKKITFWEMFFVFGILTLCLLFIIGRLFYVQVINNDKYVELAKQQQQYKEKVIPQRGNIYDRNGMLLASSIKYITIAVDPTVIKDTTIIKEKIIKDTTINGKIVKDTTIRNKVIKNIDSLAILLEKYKDIPRNETINKIRKIQKENIGKEKNKQNQYVNLARRITSDKAGSFQFLKKRGILIETEYRRHYNYSNVAAQILGYVNNESIGKDGIERQYDAILRGVPGDRYVYIDANKNIRPALDLPTTPPIEGKNLYLTIDINLQEIIEYELAKGVREASAKAGTIIALNPETGEVLACASYPNYNPNNPSEYTPEAARIRSVTDVFEPGSTFKAITASAGLEEKTVRLTDLFNGYQGLYKRATYSIKDDNPLGMTTFYNAFTQSSNIILGELAVITKKNPFMNYIQNFGFASETGIDLPGEVRGFFPKSDSVNNDVLRFLGHGYGGAVTAIQLATAYSAIANGGSLIKPYIVKKITDKDNIVIEEIKKEKRLVRKVISQNTATDLKNLLIGVVEEEKGTGKNARINNLKIAGKTGTTKKLKDNKYEGSDLYIASFAGFYPADKPKVCMYVMIDEPAYNYYGGSVAAPIFKKIALRYSSINPNIISDYVNTSITDLVLVPQLKGMKYEAAKTILASLGLKIEPDKINNKENTTITNQNPYPAAKIKKGSSVKVNTEELHIAPNTNKPNVKGLPLRSAISILHVNGYKSHVTGSGKVYEQVWKLNEKKEHICYLKCR